MLPSVPCKVSLTCGSVCPHVFFTCPLPPATISATRAIQSGPWGCQRKGRCLVASLIPAPQPHPTVYFIASWVKGFQSLTSNDNDARLATPRAHSSQRKASPVSYPVGMWPLESSRHAVQQDLDAKCDMKFPTFERPVLLGVLRGVQLTWAVSAWMLSMRVTRGMAGGCISEGRQSTSASPLQGSELSRVSACEGSKMWMHVSQGSAAHEALLDHSYCCLHSNRAVAAACMPPLGQRWRFRSCISQI
jgi:hypothetical protein